MAKAKRRVPRSQMLQAQIDAGGKSSYPGLGSMEHIKTETLKLSRYQKSLLVHWIVATLG